MIALSGLAGFVALSFEIVWFRLLGVMLKSSASTFGTAAGRLPLGHRPRLGHSEPWVHKVRDP